MELAKRLAGGPTMAIEMTKRLVNDVTRRNLDDQLQNEAWAGTRVQQSEDAGEGMSSFAESREPKWTGR